MFKWEMVREIENTYFDSLPWQNCISDFPEVTFQILLLFSYSQFLLFFRASVKNAKMGIL